MASKIEWLRNPDGRPGYTINPVKGLCPMACSYCYARRMYKRFHWDETVRYSPIVGEVDRIKKPSRIFVGSTMELFGDWIQAPWLSAVFATVRQNPQHTFIFLTKQPQNLAKWTFPPNCWVGVSVVSNGAMTLAMTNLANVEASVRFLSFEPLQGMIGFDDHMSMKGIVDWVIVGQTTPVKKSTTPKIEWVREIVEAADKAHVPVFLKDNLNSLLPPTAPFVTNPLIDPDWYLRQEFPVREER